MKVGFIGFGRMGKGMAHRVMSGGHDLAVYDVFEPATKEFRGSRRECRGIVADLCRDRESRHHDACGGRHVHDVAFGRTA